MCVFYTFLTRKTMKYIYCPFRYASAYGVYLRYGFHRLSLRFAVHNLPKSLPQLDSNFPFSICRLPATWPLATLSLLRVSIISNLLSMAFWNAVGSSFGCTGICISNRCSSLFRCFITAKYLDGVVCPSKIYFTKPFSSFLNWKALLFCFSSFNVECGIVLGTYRRMTLPRGTTDLAHDNEISGNGLSLFIIAWNVIPFFIFFKCW